LAILPGVQSARGEDESKIAESEKQQQAPEEAPKFFWRNLQTPLAL